MVQNTINVIKVKKNLASFSSFHTYNLIRKPQNRMTSNETPTYKNSWVLASACSTFMDYHNLVREQTEDTPVGVYYNIVKCACKSTRVLRTLRRVYTTPSVSHPAIAFVLYSIVEVSNVQEQSAITLSNM